MYLAFHLSVRIEAVPNDVQHGVVPVDQLLVRVALAVFLTLLVRVKMELHEERRNQGH